MDDTVTGSELDVRPAGELDAKPSLEEVEDGVAGVLEPDVEILGAAGDVLVHLEVPDVITQSTPSDRRVRPIARGDPPTLPGPDHAHLVVAVDGEEGRRLSVQHLGEPVERRDGRRGEARSTALMKGWLTPLCSASSRIDSRAWVRALWMA